MEAICLALTVRERHHGVFHQDKRWLVGPRSEATPRNDDPCLRRAAAGMAKMTVIPASKRYPARPRAGAAQRDATLCEA